MGYIYQVFLLYYRILLNIKANRKGIQLKYLLQLLLELRKK